MSGPAKRVTTNTNYAIATAVTNTSAQLEKSSAGFQVTEELQHVCDLLNIEPSALAPKSVTDFMEAGVTEKIAQLRFEHYEKRRRARLHQIHDFMASMNKRRATNFIDLPKENLLAMRKSYSNGRLTSPVAPRPQSVRKPRKNDLNRSALELPHRGHNLSVMPHSSNHNNTGIFDLTAAANTSNILQTDALEEKKQEKVLKIHQRKIEIKHNQDQRIKKLAQKTEKKSLKVEKELKYMKEETHQRFAFNSRRIQEAQTRKKMLDAEHDQKMQTKFEAYQQRANRPRTSHINSTRVFSVEQSMDEISPNTRYGAMHIKSNNHSISIADQEEAETQQKLDVYKDKIEHASMRRQEFYNQQRSRIGSQNQNGRERKKRIEENNQSFQYHTLSRYCNKEVKSSKNLKDLYADRSNLITYNREMKKQKMNLIKMNLDQQIKEKEQKTESNWQKIQDRYASFHSEVGHVQKQLNQERIEKQSLRKRDQVENYKRYQQVRRSYKDGLVNSLIEKDQRLRSMKELKKHMAVRQQRNDQMLKSMIYFSALDTSVASIPAPKQKK